MTQLPKTANDDSGYWVNCTQGKDSTGDYFAVKGDFSGYTNGISVGYQYKYEVILQILFQISKE